jgi:hypothetical protein
MEKKNLLPLPGNYWLANFTSNKFLIPGLNFYNSNAHIFQKSRHHLQILGARKVK